MKRQNNWPWKKLVVKEDWRLDWHFYVTCTLFSSDQQFNLKLEILGSVVTGLAEQGPCVCLLRTGWAGMGTQTLRKADAELAGAPSKSRRDVLVCVLLTIVNFAR
jgi:hypothetical protein